MSSGTENSEMVNLMVKRLSGEASPSEIERLDTALNTSSDLQKLFQEIEKTWIATERARGFTNEEIEEEWRRMEGAIKTSPVKPWSQWFKIAASVLLVVAVGITIFLSTTTDEIEWQAAKTSSNTLSDGSTVTLKAGSTLEYTEEFGEAYRVVHLEGEAYFEVSDDAERPFIVETKSISVEVVGTTFNVRSDGQSEVMVNSGIVDVKYQNQEVRLQAGDLASVDQSSDQLTRLRNKNPNVLSWKTLRFTFSDTPLSQVVNDLNRVYQSQIRLEGDISNCSINVSFEQESLESIIKVLQVTLGLQVRQIDGETVLSGDGC